MHALRIIPVVLFLGACRAAEAPVDEVARSDAESSAARPEIEVATGEGLAQVASTHPRS